jgi:hypothetical protein
MQAPVHDLHGVNTHAHGPFVAAAMPREAARDTVLIVAPIKCPQNAARYQKAEALARELTRIGVLDNHQHVLHGRLR